MSDKEQKILPDSLAKVSGGHKTGGEGVPNEPDDSRLPKPMSPTEITGGIPCPICGSTDTVGVGNKFKCFFCNHEFTV